MPRRTGRRPADRHGGNDDLTSGPGLDTAFGGPGNDQVQGDPGDDTLFGNFGSDVISGGPGDDFIDGDNPSPPPPGGPPFPPGTNNDDCTGGPGVDVIANCETTAPRGSDTRTSGGPARRGLHSVRASHAAARWRL